MGKSGKGPMWDAQYKHLWVGRLVIDKANGKQRFGVVSHSLYRWTHVVTKPEELNWRVSWASDAKLSKCTLDETVVPGKKLQPMVQDEFANYEDADQYILRLQKNNWHELPDENLDTHLEHYKQLEATTKEEMKKCRAKFTQLKRKAAQDAAEAAGTAEPSCKKPAAAAAAATRPRKPTAGKKPATGAVAAKAGKAPAAAAAAAGAAGPSKAQPAAAKGRAGDKAPAKKLPAAAAAVARKRPSPAKRAAAAAPKPAESDSSSDSEDNSTDDFQQPLPGRAKPAAAAAAGKGKAVMAAMAAAAAAKPKGGAAPRAAKAAANARLAVDVAPAPIKAAAKDDKAKGPAAKVKAAAAAASPTAKPKSPGGMGSKWRELRPLTPGYLGPTQDSPLPAKSNAAPHSAKRGRTGDKAAAAAVAPAQEDDWASASEGQGSEEENGEAVLQRPGTASAGRTGKAVAGAARTGGAVRGAEVAAAAEAAGDDSRPGAKRAKAGKGGAGEPATAAATPSAAKHAAAQAAKPAAGTASKARSAKRGADGDAAGPSTSNKRQKAALAEPRSGGKAAGGAAGGKQSSKKRKQVAEDEEDGAGCNRMYLGPTGRSYPVSLAMRTGDKLVSEYKDKPEEAEGDFVLEAIVDEMMVNKQHWFLVKWKGYELDPGYVVDESNTVIDNCGWEPQRNVQATDAYVKWTKRAKPAYYEAVPGLFKLNVRIPR